MTLSNTKISALQQLAASGDVRSLIDLGCRHVNGVGVPKDFKLGKSFFIRASEIGSVEAEFRLATALITENSQEGILRLRRLSASGFSPASYELGNCFYIGNLAEKNSAKAISKWREAAENGHVLADINALKYEWYYANRWKKPFIFVKYIYLACKTIWLVLSGRNDYRVMGNMNSNLRL